VKFLETATAKVIGDEKTEKLTKLVDEKKNIKLIV